MKPHVKYGLISGGISILWSLLMYITGLNRNESFQFINILSLAIPIACMVMAIKEFRTVFGNGWITFGKAFNQAFLVGLIGGVVTMGFHFLYISFIDPAFIEFQKGLQRQRYEESGMTEEMIDKYMKQSEFFMQPGMQFVFGILVSLLLAVVLSLIVAAIMKKPNPEEIA